MTITRRKLVLGTLAVTGVGIASGVGASLVACRPGAGSTVALDPARLLPALADIVAPERIGPAYRAGRDHAALVAEFVARPGLVAAAGQDCPATMRAHLQAQVRQDFLRGDVVIADRFVVARSECILAALTA